MKPIIILFFTLSLAFQSFAFRVRDINFTVDTSKFGLSNKMLVHIFIINKRGVSYELDREYDERFWNKISVTGNFVVNFNHGILTFDQAAVDSLHHVMDLKISYDTLHSKNQKITLPYIQSISPIGDFITVNRTTLFEFNLNFSNHLILSAKACKFDPNGISCKNSNGLNIKFENGFIRLDLQKPLEMDTVNLQFYDKKSNKYLGQKTVHIQYPTHCEINAVGSSGTNGFDGKNNYNTGQSGGNGTNGYTGTDGKNVMVFAKLVKLKKSQILDVYAFSSSGFMQHDIIAYEGKPIVIKAYGGKGGNGGNGGRGGSGDIDSAKRINMPYGGGGGHGGHAGNGGDGGNISFVFDQETQDISSYFLIENQGGAPGNPGEGGRGGSGDNTNTGLLGMLVGVNRGSRGAIGNVGNEGREGSVLPPQIVSAQEWENMLHNTRVKFN